MLDDNGLHVHKQHLGRFDALMRGDTSEFFDDEELTGHLAKSLREVMG
jgi:hypothetical protein